MIFSFKQFDVKHNESLLKVNTDAVLLGALVQSDTSQQKILDIGTGCGVIALMLAQKFVTAQIDALDIDSLSALEAAYNFTHSPFASRLQAYPIALQNYNHNTLYDIIVSNPPFFEVPDFSKGKNRQDISETRKKYATQYNLNFQELIANAVRLLTNEGVFWVIIPFLSKAEFLSICLNYNLHLQQEILIRSKIGNPFHRSVLCIAKEEKRNILQRILTIYNLDGSRHSEYVEVTKEFYRE